MISIELDDMRHGDNKLWVDRQGRIYYGLDERHLVFAEHLDVVGKLPPITVTDLKKIVRLLLEGCDGNKA